MNDTMKCYKNRVIKLHFLVTGTALILLSLLFLFLDKGANHVFVEFLERYFGYHLAYTFRIHKERILITVTFLAAAISWLFVEFMELSKVSKAISDMERVMGKGEERIRLPKELHELEKSVNYILLENEKNARAAKKEVERKNDLITYLAHDIRTPLASIIGYLSLLDEVPDLPPAQRVKYTGITLKKAYRLEELINEFFDITRFNLSSIPLEKEKLHLKFMLEQMTDEFYPMLSAGNRSVAVDVPEEMLLYADGDKIARVFSNLLKNAISYSYPETQIQIQAYKEKGESVITVKNEGKQIPADKLEQLFDKFFRLDSSRGSATGGAGLGLSIAREIVLQHGGSIGAESTFEGTVFTVRLPGAETDTL